MQKKKLWSKDGHEFCLILAQNFTSFMVKAMANKKRLVASFHNLSPELQEEIKQKYPLGFTDAMIRIEKPTAIFSMPFPMIPTRSAIMSK